MESTSQQQLDSETDVEMENDEQCFFCFYRLPVQLVTYYNERV